VRQVLEPVQQQVRQVPLVPEQRQVRVWRVPVPGLVQLQCQRQGQLLQLLVVVSDQDREPYRAALARPKPLHLEPLLLISKNLARKLLRGLSAGQDKVPLFPIANLENPRETPFRNFPVLVAMKTGCHRPSCQEQWIIHSVHRA